MAIISGIAFVYQFIIINSSMLNWSGIRTSILSSSSSKKQYLFSGMITLTSFPPAFKASSAAACANIFLASNPLFVFAVVLLVSTCKLRTRNKNRYCFVAQPCEV